MSTIMDTSQFCCLNEECPDYGKRGKGNIVRNRRYGRQGTQLLKCKTCGKSFSENRGTPFFNLRTPKEEVVGALKTLVERGSLRGTARVTGHKKDTIASWQKRAGEHADALREYLLHDLHLDHLEVDELYTFVEKKRRTSEATSQTLIPSERP
jgi:transposase-like protein